LQGTNPPLTAIADDFAGSAAAIHAAGDPISRCGARVPSCSGDTHLGMAATFRGGTTIKLGVTMR
jgi:hypothetical protein